MQHAWTTLAVLRSLWNMTSFYRWLQPWKHETISRQVRQAAHAGQPMIGSFDVSSRIKIWVPHSSVILTAFAHTDLPTHTHTHSYTQTLLHRHFYTRRFYTRRFYTPTLLHTDAFTHRHFYTQTLLHTNAFTHRRFYTDAFTHRRFYTQTFLHRRRFYTNSLCMIQTSLWNSEGHGPA